MKDNTGLILFAALAAVGIYFWTRPATPTSDVNTSTLNPYQQLALLMPRPTPQ